MAIANRKVCDRPLTPFGALKMAISEFDDVVQTASLLKAIEKELPFDVIIAEASVRAFCLKEGRPYVNSKARAIYVHYRQDGGILLTVRLLSSPASNDANATDYGVSLTLLRVPRSLPFYERAKSYTVRRQKRLKYAGRLSPAGDMKTGDNQAVGLPTQ
jgi:hypothetical protein